MPPPKPLTEKELTDWERWAGRDIKWEGRDVARLLAMVREQQRRIQELESRESDK